MPTSSSTSLQASIAVTRLGLGARPDELAAVASDPQGWLTSQIRPDGADTPEGEWPDAAGRLLALRDYRERVRSLRASATPSPRPDAVPTLAPVPASQPAMAAPAPKAATAAGDLMEARRTAKRPLDDATAAEVLARARLAAGTSAGFRERWTLFWSNHFTTAGKNEEMQVLSPVFEREAVRPHVFARFSTLLDAATTHPGMLHYLDQVRSVGPDSPIGARNAKRGLNENLAREILELHTVGPDAGYTQVDVTEFARALTGLTVGDGGPRGGAFGRVVFREDWHEPGARTVMGRRYADDGGSGAARAILAALAADPRTARRLSRKLAAHFTADDPPPALCARLEAAWRRSDGDLGEVARALVAAPETWAPTARKLKTPYEFLVSSWRAADAPPQDARRDVLAPLTSLGQRPFSAPQPNGWPDDAAAWSAPDAVMKRLYWAQGFAAAHAPSLDPRELARGVLGERLSPAAAQAVARAETRPEAFALLLMTPEFQRR